MSEKINKSSGIPYYIQLRDIIERRIDSGEFPDGKMPSEYELAKIYDVTKSTIRKALLGLENKDKVYKVRGLGTFVRKPKLELDLAKYISLGKILREKGISERIDLLKKEIIDFDEEISKRFDIKNPSKKVLNIERVRYLNDEPVVIEKLKFNADITKGTIDRASNGMIYSYMVNNLNIHFVSIDEYLEPIVLNKEEAKLLKVRAGFPALLITKISYDANNVWLEYTKTIIRGDRCSYHVKIR